MTKAFSIQITNYKSVCAPQLIQYIEFTDFSDSSSPAGLLGSFLTFVTDYCLPMVSYFHETLRSNHFVQLEWVEILSFCLSQKCDSL